MIGLITDLSNITHLLNIIFSIASLISGIYLQIYCKKELQNLPKNLRLFLICFCFSCGFLLSLNCIIHSTVSLLVTIPKQKFMPCTLPAFLWMILTSTNPQLYYFIIWTAFIIHSMTLIMCKYLHFKNQKMYKRLAYQVTLDERRQIAENIKVLTAIWPLIFLFSIFAPLGPASTIIFTLFIGSSGPISLFHITYHVPIIFLVFYYKYYGNKQDLKKPGIFVISPLGVILPTHVTVENYFQNLQNQWN